VCEVGSWAGRSAIIMARAGARVYCVDTWEGSKNDDGCKAYDGSRGTPLEVFKRNKKNHGVDDLITWRQGESLTVAADTPDDTFDIVYIDAEHDRDSVIADIEAWKGKARHLIAGHDYHVFAGVREAVAACGITPHVEGNVWMTRV
jgi:hypothetical protein